MMAGADEDLISISAGPGRRAVARCDGLARPPYSETPDALSRPYLTGAHKSTLQAVRGWMEAAGMAVRLDPLASLVGRYEGAHPDAPAVVIGSHIDSVIDAGSYDGPLGVMIGIEAVAALNAAGRRLPFALEVVAFGDEEGSRFPASMQCSRGMAQGLDPRALRMADAAGVTLAQALTQFGLDPETAGSVARPKGSVLAYIEVHIEQGPVLEAEGLPLGVVTGIAAQLRLKARFKGMAGHAGTSPMALRRDALAAAAEAILSVEAICRQGPEDLRGTVGRMVTGTGAFNVIVGDAEIGLDIRAASEPVRDAAADQIIARLRTIASARGVALEMEVVQDLPAAPCDPRLMVLMDKAVQSTGQRPFRLVSGAGHDAMVMLALCPVAMLFVRCEGGVSHNPLEAVTASDVDQAIQALGSFLDLLAADHVLEPA